MNSSKYIMLIIVLIVIAAVLGWAIYSGAGGSKTYTGSTSQNQTQQTKQTDQSVAAGEWNESNILQTPGENASEEERSAHFQAAVKLARETDTIILTNCKGSPVVAKAKPNQTVVFANQDSIDHTISGFDKDVTYQLAANSQKSIIMNFEKGSGLYGYGCETVAGPAGFIVISE